MRPLIYLLSFVFLLAFSRTSFAQFTGDFDHSNWSVLNENGGAINTSETILELAGGDDGGVLDYSIVVNADLLISFDWQYVSGDESAIWDPVYCTINGAQFQLTSGNALMQSGTKTVYVQSGATFSFRQQSDACCGFGQAATTTFTNFTYELAPVPGGGQTCEAAELLTPDQLSLATGSIDGTWYSYTMPMGGPKKLIFDVPTDGSAQVYHGSCDDLEFTQFLFDGPAVVTGVLPGETVFIEFFYDEPAFAWTFSVLDVLPGETCDNAMVAAVGDNDVDVTDVTGGVWYSYVMPESQKINLHSEIFELVEIYSGGCSSLSFVDSDFSEIEITGIEPGEPFYIKWSTNFSNQNFTWTLEEVDYEPGDLCANALDASEGQNNIDSDGGDVWYKFTMPDEPGKKLIITSDIFGTLDLYAGDCGELELQYSEGTDATLKFLFPGQQIFIRWNTNFPDQLSWNLAVEDLQPGEGCLTAIQIDANVNSGNVLIPADLEEVWYSVLVPANKKLVVTSPTSKYVENFAGPCSNISFQVVDGNGGFESPNFVEGQTALIRWFPGGESFTFNVSFEDLLPGEGCSTAEVAEEGPNLLVADGSVSTYVYQFTMPLGSPKKLRLTSSEFNYVNFYHGPCGALEFAAEDFGNLLYSEFSPGETIFINWSVSQGDNFTWHLTLEDVGPGDNCSLAFESVAGVNNSSLAPQWFTYTMPATGDIKISSVGLTSNDTYLRVYDGCGGAQLAVSDDFQNSQSQVTLNNVSSGATLKILWDDEYSSAGFNWSISLQNVSQSITFDELESRTILDAPFQLEASATSGLPVTFQGNNENVATINGNTVTIVGLGEVTITASQPGDVSFNAAQPVMRTLTITKASQTITFGELESKTIIDDDFEIAATSSSGLDVSFHSTEESVATVQGNTITIVGIGETTITASQSGNDIYNAATPVARTLVVTKASQSITFGELSNKSVGDADFEISASSSSGLPVTFSSLNTFVATISGNLVTIVGPGTATIKAEQIGDATYAVADPVERTLIVKSNQSISFEALPSKTFGDAPFELSASATSGLAVTFKSSSPEIAAVNGNTVTILHAGTVTITAVQEGDDLHNPGLSVDRTLVISKAAQQITFAPIAAKTIGDAAVQLSVSSTSSLPVTVSSSDPASAQIVGATINLLKAGSVTITATQVGSDDYLPASPVAQTFCINPAKPSISANFNNDGAPVLTSSSSSGNQWYRNGVAIGSSTGVTHTVTLAGDYSVVTSAGSCASAPSEAFTVVVTDIPDRETDLKAYPNPATDYLIVEGTKEHAAFEAIGVSGISFKVDSQWIKSSQHTKVVVSELPSGFYSLLVRQGVKSSRVKFIKK